MVGQFSTLEESYKTLVAEGALRPDATQTAALNALQDFADSLNPAVNHNRVGAFGLGRLVNGWKSKAVASPPAPTGLYIYGDVGRGKSMLMDLFVRHVAVTKKRRVHFHQFMREIHAHLHTLRQKHETADIMQHLVRDLADETSLLCFDEFHVSNIADAMILGRLFDEMFKAGIRVVATSNWAPDDLYKNGLQRDRFMPFIALMKQRMIVHHMAGVTDYRYEQVRNLDTYIHPLGLDTTRKLQGIFIDLTHDAPPEHLTLPVDGRELNVSQTANGIGFFNFDELCERALGAGDYLAIAECLHTVILDGVPVLRDDKRNEAERFKILIDTLYEAKVKLFMGAEAPIENLFPIGSKDMSFQRTLSRLEEMRGETYRHQAHFG